MPVQHRRMRRFAGKLGHFVLQAIGVTAHSFTYPRFAHNTARLSWKDAYRLATCENPTSEAALGLGVFLAGESVR